MQSLSIGGATIDGRIVSADGRVVPVHYSYFSPTLRDVVATTTWGDANWTLSRFAHELGRGQLMASR
jgi:hypothetical protein